MKAQKNNWVKIRKLLNDIHLWLGLISGIVIFFVCLSGTLYTYNTEIIQASEPHLHQVSNSGYNKKKTAIALVNAVPLRDSLVLSSIQIPYNHDESYAFLFTTPDGNRKNSKTYYVNPYSGELLGTSDPDKSAKKFMRYLFSLHRWLLLDRIEEPIFGKFPNRKLGSLITGICTILFTLGVITGIIIWFPNKLRSWKQGLKIKTGGNWKRTNHDLHNTLGFYAFLILFLMGVTGPFFSFEWYRNGLRKTLGTYKVPTTERNKSIRGGDHKNEKSTETKSPVTFPLENMEKIVSSANHILPYNGDYTISFDDGKIIANKTGIGFFAPAGGDKITFDIAGNQVLKVEKFSDKPFNEKLSSSIKAIHLGSVFGGFSKLIYFISCLIATSLPVTGTLIWVNKMKKKR